MRSIFPTSVLLAGAMFAGLAAARAQTPQSPGITADHAWARASAGQGTTGAAYLTLTGTGMADRITAVSAPVAAKAELHETIDDHGVMRMRPVPQFTLQPRASVTFKPGGLHIMLMGLKQPLRPGDHFPITLTFEHAPPVTTEVTVGTVGQSAPPALDAMDHDSMPGMPHR